MIKTITRQHSWKASEKPMQHIRAHFEKQAQTWASLFLFEGQKHNTGYWFGGLNTQYIPCIYTCFFKMAQTCFRLRLKLVFLEYPSS